jgi:hypothetical protein
MSESIQERSDRIAAACVSVKDEVPRSSDTEIEEAIEELKEGQEAIVSALEIIQRTRVCFRTLLTARNQPVPAPACTA